MLPAGSICAASLMVGCLGMAASGSRELQGDFLGRVFCLTCVCVCDGSDTLIRVEYV